MRDSFLEELKEKGFLSEETISILELLAEKKLASELVATKEKREKELKTRWYMEKLEYNFDHVWKDTLNVELWKKAMENGYELYRLSCGGEIDTYFLKPKDFPFYLMFFGDQYGFLPQFLEITEGKFKEYISKKKDFKLDIVLEVRPLKLSQWDSDQSRSLYPE